MDTLSGIQMLSELYYSPKTGFCGLKQLYELARENSLDLTTTEIAKWYREQPVNQIFKTEQTMSNIPFFAKKVGQIQADLIDIHLLARKNDGYKWI